LTRVLELGATVSWVLHNRRIRTERE